MTRRLGAALGFAILLSCDNGKQAGGGGPAAAHIVLHGEKIRVTVVAAEKDRRAAPLRLERVEGPQGHLLAWPRERFVKLESQHARASFDVAFLDRAGKVVDVQLFAQGDREGIQSKAEAAYALLAAPGSLERLGVRAGDPTDLPPEVKAAPPEDLPRVRIGDVEVRVELALDEAERAQGLMFRPRLSADDGMLFVYPSEGHRSFWMGNTLIPLDIAFFRSDGTLLNVNETPVYPDPRNPPPSYATSSSDGPARFVLETNLGWFRRKGIVDKDGKVIPGTKALFPFEALRGFSD
jgi:hypothetical protein